MQRRGHQGGAAVFGFTLRFGKFAYREIGRLKRMAKSLGNRSLLRLGLVIPQKCLHRQPAGLPSMNMPADAVGHHGRQAAVLEEVRIVFIGKSERILLLLPFSNHLGIAQFNKINHASSFRHQGNRAVAVALLGSRLQQAHFHALQPIRKARAFTPLGLHFQFGDMLPKAVGAQQE